jgi:hypothetical protein
VCTLQFPNSVTLRISGLPDAAQMRVLKALRVLQALPKNTVEARMCEEDQPFKLERLSPGLRACHIHQQAGPFMVKEVVAVRTDPFSSNVSERTEIRRQKQHGEPPPGVFQCGEKEDRKQRQGELCEAEKVFHNGSFEKNPPAGINRMLTSPVKSISRSRPGL